MIEEVLSWVIHLSEKRVTATITTNLVFVLYSLSFLTHFKGRYIATFLLCTVFGTSFISDYFSSVNYYCFLGMCYMALYHECHKKNDNLLILLGCVTMALFESVMSFDAILYPNTQTVIWNNYASIILLIHCAIIFSSTDFRKIGHFILSIKRFFADHYNLAFILYNIRAFSK